MINELVLFIEERVIKINNLFTEIYLKYHKDIFRLIYSYVLNITEAEDILQQTFLKLYNHIRKFKSADLEVKKWLIRVAVNESKNYLHSFWKRNGVLEENLDNYGKTIEEDEMFEIMEMIPQKYRIPIYLYYYEGYKIEEIAKILKVSVSSIKIFLKKGKEKMKNEIGRMVQC